MKKEKSPKKPKEDLGKRFKNKCKSLLSLFWSMFKIGLFTFGGGYAMIHLLENEFVAKKKWLDNDEFFDLVTIAESTPGPVAINCSTYIGYKTNSFIGALVATTAMCIPSFVIIFLISLFFNAFLENVYIAAAFKGIQVCAVFLILCAGIKMAKKIKLNVYNVIIFIATFIAMILVSIFDANFSSIFYILISGAIGLFIYSIGYFKNKIKEKKQPIAIDSKSPSDAESNQNAESDIQSEQNTMFGKLTAESDSTNDNEKIETHNSKDIDNQPETIAEMQNSTDFHKEFEISESITTVNNEDTDADSSAEFNHETIMVEENLKTANNQESAEANTSLTDQKEIEVNEENIAFINDDNLLGGEEK